MTLDKAAWKFIVVLISQKLQFASMNFWAAAIADVCLNKNDKMIIIILIIIRPAEAMFLVGVVAQGYRITASLLVHLTCGHVDI